MSACVNVGAGPCASRARGFSLVEVLVATAIAGVALAGAWAWLWSVAPPARCLEAQAQSAGAAAFALRTLSHDSQEATTLLAPTACAPDRGLVIEHHHPGAGDETVVVVWDASRQVLWRKTSSTYLADHVTEFAVAYLSASGEQVVPSVAGQRLTGVGRVALELTVNVNGQSRTSRADIPVRVP